MSFNKNKWAVIVEPTYQSYKVEIGGRALIPDIDYKSVEVPIGVRHYFFLNDNTSKLFANALFVFDIPLDSSIGLKEITASPNLGFGIGYNFLGKYSLELRYYTSRNVLGSYPASGAEYNTLSFIVGYSLF